MCDIMKIRINKYIQRYAGISRRQADKLIERGIVKIDGVKASLGDTVIIGKQTITIDGKKIIPLEKDNVYIVMNKPVGYICSRKGNKTVFDILPSRFNSLSYIGRLDVNTSGVLLFTDDGDFIDKILRSNIPRVYYVRLNSILDEDAISLLKKGPMLDGRPVKLGKINIKGSEVVMEIYEGRWREVRRIFGSLGYSVLEICRTEFGNIKLGNLKTGRIRRLTELEIRNLRKFT